VICSLTTKSVVQPLMGDINHCFWSLCFIFVHGLNCLLRFMIFTDGIVCSTFGNFIHGLNCLLKFVIFTGGLNCLLNFWEFYSWGSIYKICSLITKLVVSVMLLVTLPHSVNCLLRFGGFFIHGCDFYPWPQLFAQVCDFYWWPQLFAQLLGILFMGLNLQNL
jgi:hypothetical protein